MGFVVGGIFIFVGIYAIVTGTTSINEGFIELSGRNARILGLVSIVIGLICVALQAWMML
jgi:Ca2+/Na+ antiporter